jgi:hypothetical protein
MTFLPDSVAIMIPCYNQQEYIAQAIESCLAQDYRPLSIVVSDDSSSDSTGRIASGYADRGAVRYFRNERNIGRVANYNKTLMDRVDAEWVVNLDGDDYYTDNSFVSDAMADIREARKRGFSVVAHMGNHRLDLVRKHIPNLVELASGALCCPGTEYFLHYARSGQFAHMSCIYKAETARRAGGYKLDSVAADFHALMQVFLQGAVILSDKFPGVWRVHDSNASLSNLKQKYLSAFSMYEELALHAAPFFPPRRLEQWKGEMRDGAYDDYVLTTCSNVRGVGGLLSLLRDFRPRAVYLDAVKVLVKRMLKL